MTSLERKQARYQRRQLKRKQNREKILNNIGTAEEIFTYHNLFNSGLQCLKNIMWKQSAQSFKRHLFSRTAVNRYRVLNNYQPKPLKHFIINERGKTRNIGAPHIDDRQIQKLITWQVLKTLYLPYLIKDNGASLKGKGLLFSQKQLDKQLKKYFKKYNGWKGFIIIADFHGFFPNADRTIVKNNHKNIKDKKLLNIINKIVDMDVGTMGLPIGLEPSQIEMIYYPSSLDQYMNCQQHLITGHYMDDYHILVPPNRNPKQVLQIFIKKAKENNISISKEKTRIIPLGKQFKFCKIKRRFIGEKIIKQGCPASFKRTKRKIKMFAKNQYCVNEIDIFNSIQSSMAYQKQYNNHNKELKLNRLFYNLFNKNSLQQYWEKINNEIYMS